MLRDEELTSDEIAERAGITKYAAKCVMEASLTIGTVLVDSDSGKFTISKIGWFLVNDPATIVNVDFNHDVNYLGMFDLETALKEDPSNGYFAVELAMMQSDLMKNPRRSEEILSDHLRRDPESKMVSAAYADFLSQHGREREATPYFARAAAGNAPTEAYAQYGHHLMRMHNPEKAAEAYRSAFEKTQADFEAKTSRGESTVIIKQELSNRAIDLGHAEKQRGNEAGWARMVEVAGRYLPENDPQLRILRNPTPAQPVKPPSE